ncbi:MAG: hypothetical protein R3F35_07325 [Myxococcota bacterium]
MTGTETSAIRAAGACALLVAGLLVPRLGSAASEATGVLATPDQIALERSLLRVLASEAVVQEKRAFRERLLEDPLASDPDGRATLDRALDGITTAMVQCGVNSDSQRPKAMWNAGAAHAWHGFDVPAAGYGIENPDNVYRTIPMDGASSYEVTGRVRDPGPSQLSFTLYAARPDIGANPPVPQEGSGLLGALSGVETDSEGRFVVTVDPRPADGRRNHLQSAQPTALLVVRDTLGDWKRQRVSEIQVRRVAGPARDPEPDLDRLVERSIACMREQIPLWLLHYNQKYILGLPPNRIQQPRIRSVGWGVSRSAPFEIAEDEALVVTLDRIGARYLGFQLVDPWGMALEYVSRTGSLNDAQAQPNADGTFTYVISPRDPGVHNWLDTSGLHKGILTIRWQGFAAPVESTEGAVRGVRLVKRARLAEALPPETVRMTPAARAKQLEERLESYRRRLER